MRLSSPDDFRFYFDKAAGPQLLLQLSVESSSTKIREGAEELYNTIFAQAEDFSELDEPMTSDFCI